MFIILPNNERHLKYFAYVLFKLHYLFRYLDHFNTYKHRTSIDV